MRIYVKLFAMLEDRLPPGSRDHTMALEVGPGMTPRRVIDQLGIPASMAHLVLIGGVHLLPAEIESRPLQEGESLSIFPPIAGG